jgi:AraC-like DNA-binding protein
MEAIGLLLSTHGTSRVRQRGCRADDGLAVRAHALLADTPHRVVTIAELGATLGASTFQVIRAVRAHYGLTPHQLHLQLRTVRARALVLAGRPISEAAAACGFADQAHFTREMRRRWGLPPGATRRALLRSGG